MEKSIYETSHQMGNINNFFAWLLVLFLPFVGIALIALLIFVCVLSPITLPMLWPLCLGLFAGIFLIIQGLFMIDKGLAKYRFEKEGLVVKYPFKKEKLILWNEFQQVCVCYGAYTTRGTPRASSVICCVKKGEKTNIYGRWKTDNPFHAHTVITIDYKLEYYNGIKERCPYDVPDLRDTPAYRLK